MKKHKIVIREVKEWPVIIEAKTIAEAKNIALQRFKNEKPVNAPLYELEALSEQKFRSDAQNRSLHKWLTWYAEAIKEKGLTVKEIVDNIDKYGDFEMFPSMIYIKEQIFKPIMQKEAQINSTTKLDRWEHFEEVKKIFVNFIKKITDVDPIIWPSKEAQYYEKFNQK